MRDRETHRSSDWSGRRAWSWGCAWRSPSTSSSTREPPRAASFWELFGWRPEHVRSRAGRISPCAWATGSAESWRRDGAAALAPLRRGAGDPRRHRTRSSGASAIESRARGRLASAASRSPPAARSRSGRSDEFGRPPISRFARFRGERCPPIRRPRSRWMALYVLCVGVLMIVLDATIVNGAAVDPAGSRLLPVEPRLGRQRLPDRLRRLLLLAGRLGDLISRRGVFLVGLLVFCVASLACGLAQSQEMLVAARFVQGVGGALASAVVLGMIVTMFPEPREQARAIGVYAFVASGRVGRPPRRRRPHPGDQLALDLLREHPDRHRHGHLHHPAAGERQGHRFRRGRRRARRGPHHRRADAARLHDRRAGGRARLGRHADARARRDRDRPARGLRGTRGRRAR